MKNTYTNFFKESSRRVLQFGLGIAIVASGAVYASLDTLDYTAPSAPVQTGDTLTAPLWNEVRDNQDEFAAVFGEVKSWKDSLTSALFVNADGNVGIGTTEPGANLEIMGTNEQYPNNKTLLIHANGESQQFRDQVTINSDLSTGYGIAFTGDNHHRGGIYAVNTGGEDSSRGDVYIWARGEGNVNVSNPLLVQGQHVMQERKDIGNIKALDWNTLIEPGMYLVTRANGDTGDIDPLLSSLNQPTTYPYGHLVVTEAGGLQQTYYPHTGSGSTGGIFIRTGWNNGSWQPWGKIAITPL